MDFNNTGPFEVTMAAGSTVVTADIPIFDDEINEAAEDFVVVWRLLTAPIQWSLPHKLQCVEFLKVIVSAS